MNRNDQDPDVMLDALLAEVRSDEPDAATVAAAGSRVWASIAAEAAVMQQQHASVEAIDNCAGFQALFSEYREGTLSPARRMLVEDHLHTCVACRKQLAASKAPKVVAMPSRPAAQTRPSWQGKWAMAAALFVSVGVGSIFAWLNFGPAPDGARASIQSVEGGVYRLQGNTLQPVSAGAEFGERAVLRTAGNARATVRLIDGSTVEVGERAEFSVSATRRDTTVHLDRGQVIVQAAKRSSGHLFVATPDSRVAVTGTIFSVNRGVAGSRVSVVEGEVHVEHAQQKDILHAGDQVATHASIARNTVAEDIAWSRNADQYIALLKQFAEIKNKLAQVRMPGLRYGSRLMDAVPAGTTIYVSLPNLGGAMQDLRRIVSDQARQSPELQTLMTQQMPEFEKIMGQMTRIHEFLGEEVVIAFQPCKGMCGVLIAETTKPGLKEYVDAEMAKLGAKDTGEMKIVYAGNRVYLGHQGDYLETAAHGGSRFAESGFGRTVEGIYRRGAGLFVAADLETIFPGDKMRNRYGFSNVRHFIAEQKDVNGKGEYSAVVTFAGEREGIASWLGNPGGMGSLGFVSPDAQFATSFVVKQPARMLQDALAFADGKRLDTAEMESALGITPEQLAAFLGGEVTIAIDGPMLPLPSWKLIAEVNDATGLQTAFNRMLELGNQKLKTSGQPELTLKQETVNGRTFYSIKSPFAQIPMDIHYTYVDGYLFAAPNRPLLERAIRDRAAGITLASSQEFTKRLPRDSRASFSAMMWQNAGDLLNTVAQLGASLKDNLTPEQQKQADDLIKSAEPTLVCLYGESDRIEIASQGSAMNMLMQGFASQLMPGAARMKTGTKGPRASYRN